MLADVPEDALMARQKVFGPVTQVRRFKDSGLGREGGLEGIDEYLAIDLG